MKRIITLLLPSLFTILTLSAQRVQNPAFEKKISGLLSKKTPVRTVQEIAETYKDYVLLDAREIEEYNTSHIPGAIHIGYDDFELSSVTDIAKDAPIIVYCSIGYRSGKVTQKLRKAGYNNSYNLFGSIFEWANCNLPLEDFRGNTTETVHTYNKKWSQWVTNPEISKEW